MCNLGRRRAGRRVCYNSGVWMRVILALVAAASGFLRTMGRITRELFHEAAGAFFVLFAVVGGVSAWRAWERQQAMWLIALSLGFMLMMAGFAVASFRSARRVR